MFAVRLEVNAVELLYGTPEHIDAWMELVKLVSMNFPGLETREALEEHRETVLRYMEKRQALCEKDESDIAGVMLFSRPHNMICCLAVSPAFRRQGVASMLMDEALRRLDRTRKITVSTFRAEDEKGAAPRALYLKYGFIPDVLTLEFGYPSQQFVLHETSRGA